ncbi:hypothetical protein PAMP_019226 [Pampus punctatissimus]
MRNLYGPCYSPYLERNLIFTDDDRRTCKDPPCCDKRDPFLSLSLSFAMSFIYGFSVFIYSHIQPAVAPPHLCVRVMRKPCINPLPPLRAFPSFSLSCPRVMRAGYSSSHSSSSPIGSMM